MAYVFVPVPLPLWAKAPLLILLGLLLSWAISAFVLTKTPLLRRVFAWPGRRTICAWHRQRRSFVCGCRRLSPRGATCVFKIVLC